jgi:glycosyltransferase involved in cell wall biosynthesis
VLYSALAFGKPIVMTAVGGFPEVAEEHGAARLVPPEDPGALAAALNELLADPAERERLGAAAARASAGPYSWDAIGARTLALYQELGA